MENHIINQLRKKLVEAGWTEKKNRVPCKVPWWQRVQKALFGTPTHADLHAALDEAIERANKGPQPR